MRSQVRTCTAAGLFANCSRTRVPSQTHPECSSCRNNSNKVDRETTLYNSCPLLTVCHPVTVHTHVCMTPNQPSIRRRPSERCPTPSEIV